MPVLPYVEPNTFRRPFTQTNGTGPNRAFKHTPLTTSTSRLRRDRIHAATGASTDLKAPVSHDVYARPAALQHEFSNSSEHLSQE